MRSLVKFGLLGMLLLGAILNLQATTFETVRDGNWSDPSTWAGGVYPSTSNQGTLLPPPPNWFTKSTGDRIIIRHQVTLDYNLLILGTDVLLIDTGGVMLATAGFDLLNLSPGQAAFPGGGVEAGLIIRGKYLGEYLRNTGIMDLDPIGEVEVFGNFDSFAQTELRGSFQLVNGLFFIRQGQVVNQGAIVVNQGNFLNRGSFVPDTNSCTSIYGNFVNDSLATVNGLGYIWVQDTLDNGNNPTPVWTNAEYCAGTAINLPPGLTNCANPNCNGISPLNCRAAFRVLTLGQSYTFENLSVGDFGSYQWDLGDGTSSTLLSPSHAYSTPGVYTVCLSVFDSSGTFCDSVCQEVNYLTGPCSANFQYLQSGNTVNFANASTGNISGFAWDFGDGGTAGIPNPGHIYLQPDTYQVCMTLFAPQGGVCDSLCRSVVVAPDSCTADFSYTINGDTAAFTFTGFGNYTDAVWDFGDGQQTTSNLNPRHGYAQPGSYTVCLTLLEVFGTVCDSICQTVIVPPGNCTANYSFTQTDSLLSFTNLSSGDFASLEWDYGDGNFDTLFSPTHIYDTTGFFIVCLRLFDDFGLLCDSMCDTLNIGVLAREGSQSDDVAVTFYPNPVEEALTLVVTGKKEQELRLEIQDLSGRELWQSAFRVQPGETRHLHWNRTDAQGRKVAAGMYYLKLYGSRQLIPGQIFKLVLIR